MLVSDNVREAVRMLGEYTGGRFDIWALAGRGGKPRLRALILGTMEGRRVPQAKAGVYAIRAAFYAGVGAVGGCEAERERDFVQRCQALAVLPAGVRVGNILGKPGLHAVELLEVEVLNGAAWAYVAPLEGIFEGDRLRWAASSLEGYAVA